MSASVVEAPSFKLSDYDFEYPESLVADKPAEPRDTARLMVLNRKDSSIRHAIFRDLPQFLNPGDCIVVNRTKVIPARLIGKKASGGKVEALLVKELEPKKWTALASRLAPGMKITFPGGLEASVESLNTDGEWVLAFTGPEVRAVLQEHGLAPLPPYIQKRRAAGAYDRERYQTVYAREEGSIAAPTAGFHFTPGVFSALAKKGVAAAEIILHVGPGTFRPVTAEDVREHRMLPERFEVPAVAAESIFAAHNRGGRVVAVGTTATRALEFFLSTGRESGETGLFIHPGYAFRGADALITNFHLPRSTPLLLASAFAGRERLLTVYHEAVQESYRLFSYGDSMLIL